MLVFEYHSRVRLRFKLAACLSKSWTLDGGVPQGFSLSMMFILALYLPWCRYLAAQKGVEPQLYAHNLKCVSGDPGVLLRAAKFTTRDCVSKRTDCRPTPFLMLASGWRMQGSSRFGHHPIIQREGAAG